MREKTKTERTDMDPKKIEQLKAGLEAAEKVAAELLSDKVQGQSPHAGPLRCRVLAALESLEAHQDWANGQGLKAES
jgi:hypothetical protein